MVAPPDADVTLPTAAEPPDDLNGAIETLTLSDPEATVVRRRSQHLGRPEIGTRETQAVDSAAALIARLYKK